MELDHEFTVPVPVEQAWPVLLDVERVAPCMPGATLESIEGDDFTGRLKVKVGPVTVTYRGKAGFTHKDEQNHTATIEGTGKEARGSGTASATVRAQLEGEGESTRVKVHTDLQVTGRPAQFGRNVMSEVGAKLIGKFADCLAEQLAGAPQQEQEAPGAATSGAAPSGASSDTAGSGAATSTAGAGAAGAAGAGSPGSPAAMSSQAAAPSSAAAATSPNGAAQASGDGQPGGESRAGAATQPRASSASGTGENELNLFDIAGGPALKRVLPAIGGLAALLGIIVVIRRKRRR